MSAMKADRPAYLLMPQLPSLTPASFREKNMAACKCFLVELLFRFVGRHLVEGKHICFDVHRSIVHTMLARARKERRSQDGCA